MKCMIVLALVAAASASIEYGSVVEGSKAILAGPSGTIHADTGSIVKSGALLGSAIVAPRLGYGLPLAAPLVAPRLIGAPIIPHVRRIESHLPLLSPVLAAPRLASPLLHSGLVEPILGARTIIGSRGLGWDSGLYGARSYYGGLY